MTIRTRTGWLVALALTVALEGWAQPTPQRRADTTVERPVVRRESWSALVERSAQDAMHQRRGTLQVQAEPGRIHEKQAVAPLERETGSGRARFREARGAAPQDVSLGFPAIDLDDQLSELGTGSIPPDTMGAVGPDHFVEIINTSVAVFTRGGTRLSHVGLATFFGSASGAFDPRVLYDRRSGRWIASTLNRGVANSDNDTILAVSDDASPTGMWSFVTIPVGEPNTFTDYETLGTDDNGIYIGHRLFPNAGPTVAKLAVVNKGLLLTNATLNVAFFDDITDMFSVPQPAHNHDPVGPTAPAFFVASSEVAFGTVKFRRVTWSGGMPTIDASATTVATPSYAEVVQVTPLGSTTNLSFGDDRMMMAVIRGGRLWCTRHVGLNSAGTAAGADRTGVEWFEFDVTSFPPTLIQSGRIFDTGTSNPISYVYPSIMVSGQGHAAVGFSGVTTTNFVGAYFSGRLAGDALGTMGGPELIKAGEASYQRLDGIGRNRWGDYSYTSLDPRDDMTMWTIQEYAATPANTWGTWVAALRAPAPSISAFTASVAPGTLGASIQVPGTGFYDNPTVPHRLSVTIGGDGISNVSVTAASSVHVAVTFDVADAATPGPRTLTVINPDGQLAVATNGLVIGSGTGGGSGSGGVTTGAGGTGSGGGTTAGGTSSGGETTGAGTTAGTATGSGGSGTTGLGTGTSTGTTTQGSTGQGSGAGTGIGTSGGGTSGAETSGGGSTAGITGGSGGAVTSGGTGATGVETGGTGGTGGGTGGAVSERLGWVFEVKKPRSGKAVTVRAGAGIRVAGRLTDIDLPKKTEGVQVEMAVIEGEVGPTGFTSVVWEDARKVGKVSVKGRLKFKGPTDLGSTLELDPDDTLTLLLRATRPTNTFDEAVTPPFEERYTVR